MDIEKLISGQSGFILATVLWGFVMVLFVKWITPRIDKHNENIGKLADAVNNLVMQNDVAKINHEAFSRIMEKLQDRT
jgi:uncharacterized membrane protein